MERIDAHQHFWRYDASRHSWITDEMTVIRRDFLPADLALELQKNNIQGCVAVQADQTREETEFLLQLANENPFVKGVVGWVDLQADNITEELTRLKGHKKLKGFRHILQAEPDDGFMLRPAFLKGIKELARHGFVYDILVFPRHLAYTEKLVQQCPEQRFVIDHLAKPAIKTGGIKQWEKDMRLIAGYPNVWCKLSGMITEADWKQWKKEDIYPYIDIVMEAFGAKRLMFGSDWPVCLVAGNYNEVAGLVNDYTAALTKEERDRIFGMNAKSFYNLD